MSSTPDMNTLLRQKQLLDQITGQGTKAAVMPTQGIPNDTPGGAQASTGVQPSSRAGSGGLLSSALGAIPGYNTAMNTMANVRNDIARIGKPDQPGGPMQAPPVFDPATGMPPSAGQLTMGADGIPVVQTGPQMPQLQAAPNPFQMQGGYIPNLG